MIGVRHERREEQRGSGRMGGGDEDGWAGGGRVALAGKLRGDRKGRWGLEAEGKGD